MSVSETVFVYAPAASDAFNEELGRRLAELARDVRDAVGRPFVALLLGGGYGRGEGAVTRAGGREAPYNDLDLFLVADRLGRGARVALDALRRRWARELAVHVDVGGPYAPSRVAGWGPRLMWFDLLNGHQVLSGPANVLDAAPPSARAHPPAIEATRLLLNRGAGLLWALRVARGVEAEPEPDFVRRNYWKGALALGDATLLAHGRYATPGATRAQRLRILEASNPAVERLGLGADYESALRFKLEPDSLSPDAPPLEALRELALRWGRVLLHVESRRTGRAWESLEAYADREGPREADENRPSRRVANLVRNALSGAVTAAHPRERLYRRLPLLLVGEGPSRAAWDRDGSRFLRTWSRFNG